MPNGDNCSLKSSLKFATAAVAVVVQAQCQELKCSSRPTGYFTLLGDKTLPVARDSSEVTRA